VVSWEAVRDVRGRLGMYRGKLLGRDSMVPNAVLPLILYPLLLWLGFQHSWKGC